MPFLVPSLDETHAILLADYANRFPNADVSRYSDNWKRTRVTALAVTALHAHVQVVYDDLMPDRSTGVALERLGAIYGVARKPATAAYRTAAARATGTAGSLVTLGAQLVHRDGTIYYVTAPATIPGGGTFVDFDISGDDRSFPIVTDGVGSKTRKSKGEVLTFVSPPAGINGSVELQLDLNQGGADTEPVGTYRVRLLDKIAQPGMGGNANDYRTWMLSQTGVDTAYVFPLRQGLGSVDTAFLHTGRGAARIPTPTEIAIVKAYLDTQRPVSVADFRVLTVVAEPNDVEVLVTPTDDPQYAFDWDDTLPPTVNAYNPSTRVLGLSARPTDMRSGHRLVYKATVMANDGAEVVVESLGPAATEVTLSSLTAAQAAAPPVAGNLVYAGGGLVEPLRQAILALFDALGPARGTDAAKASGLWEDKLRTSTLFRTVQLSPGVLDSIIVTPSANVAAENVPPSFAIGLITPNQILVRRG